MTQSQRVMWFKGCVIVMWVYGLFKSLDLSSIRIQSHYFPWVCAWSGNPCARWHSSVLCPLVCDHVLCGRYPLGMLVLVFMAGTALSLGYGQDAALAKV